MHAEVSLSVSGGSVPCWVSLLELSLGAVVEVVSSLVELLESPLELDSGCSVVLVSSLLDPLDSVVVELPVESALGSVPLLLSGSIDVDPLPDDSLLPSVFAGLSSPHAATATNEHATHDNQRHSMRRG
jgi:hypothetical protein